MVVGVCVCLGAVHGAIRVLRRRVDRIHLEILVSGVYDVVPGACGDDEGPVILYCMTLLDFVLARPEVESTLAHLDTQKLVEVTVSLPSDLAPGRHRHDSQLAVFPGVHDSPEVVVVHGQSLDVVDPSNHGCPFGVRPNAIRTNLDGTTGYGVFGDEYGENTPSKERPVTDNEMTHGSLSDDDIETVGQGKPDRTDGDNDAVDGTDSDGVDSTDSDGVDSTDSDGVDSTDSDGVDSSDTDGDDSTDSDSRDN